MWATEEAASSDNQQQLASNEILSVLLPGAPRAAHRFRRLHTELLTSTSALLPCGWEQRLDRASGRLFYINHSQRTTCWTDPRLQTQPELAADAMLSESSDSDAGSVAPEPPPPRAVDPVAGTSRETDAGPATASTATDEEPPLAPAATPGVETKAHPAEPQQPDAAEDAASEAAPPAPQPAAASRETEDEGEHPRADSAADRLPPVAPPPAPGHTAPGALQSELLIFRSGFLLPTPSRLARHATLHLDSALASLYRRLPGASREPGCAPHGFDLLLQRRCKLLQKLHIALRRERKRQMAPRRPWQELYDGQRRSSAPRRSVLSHKQVSRALETLARHSGAGLTEQYTSWFKTRSHLERCSMVLKQLAPLQLLGSDEFDGFEALVEVLQQKLIAVATAGGYGASRGLISPAPSALSLHLSSSADAPPIDSDRAAPTALSALLRLALLRGELADLLLLLQALLATAGHRALRASDGAMAACLPLRTCELIDGLRELETCTATVLEQRGLVIPPSTSLGAVHSHPTIGIYPSADFPSRSVMLTSGHIEPSAAAAAMTATVAKAAVATVWGVGPWEHDLSSLLSEPPPSEIASAVAMAAVDVPSGSSPSPRAIDPVLPLHVPLCVDVSPSTLQRLLSVLAETLAATLALEALQSTTEIGLMYTCLALLRLLKVHLHYVSVCRLSLAELGLTKMPPPVDGAESMESTASLSRPEGVSASPQCPEAASTAGPAAADLSGVSEETGHAVQEDSAKSVVEEGAGVEEQLSPRSTLAEAARSCAAAEHRGDSCEAEGVPMPSDRVLAVRQHLLRLACHGSNWTEPVNGSPVGEQATAEAIAVLQVGRDVFFPSALERQALLLKLLAAQPCVEEPSVGACSPAASPIDSSFADGDHGRSTTLLGAADPSKSSHAAPTPAPLCGSKSSVASVAHPKARTSCEADVQGDDARASSGLLYQMDASCAVIALSESAVVSDRASTQAGRLCPSTIFAQVLMASFAQQPDVSELMFPSTGSTVLSEHTDTSNRDLQLLHHVLEMIGAETCGVEPMSPLSQRSSLGRLRGPSAALVLLCSSLCDLLSRAAEAMSIAEHPVQSLLLCSRLLFDRATELLQRDAQPEGCSPSARATLADASLRSSFFAMLPSLCAGLSLLSSFAGVFAQQLLPRLLGLIEVLHAEESADAQQHFDSVDEQEDFDLLDLPHRVESAHPYTDGCSQQCIVTVPSSTCVWIRFDPRCSTIEAEARLELLSDNHLWHTFSGPPSAWPKEPVVIPQSAVTLRFTAKVRHCRSRSKHQTWGFACRAHGFEPCFGPSLPVLLDCQKGTLSLAARYATILIAAEPLSPEERAHAAILESDGLDGRISDGAALPLPASLLQPLLEKRRRRAASRATGLEAMVRLLQVSTLDSNLKQVLTHFSRALQSLEPPNGYGFARRRSLFLLGCSGCGAEQDACLRTAVVKALQLLTTKLRETLQCLRRGPPSSSPTSTRGRGDEAMRLLCLPFLLRFQLADHPLLLDGGVPELARQLRTASSRHHPSHRLCATLFEHLLLISFAHQGTRGHSLSGLQLALLELLHSEVVRVASSLGTPAQRDTSSIGPEQDAQTLMKLLLSLCTSQPLLEQLVGETWIRPFARLVRMGSPQLAHVVLRTLRHVLPLAAPSSRELPGLFVEDDDMRERSVSSLIMEAIGRETCGDEPLVARVGQETAAGKAAWFRRGTPNGVVAAELCELLRHMQRTGGEEWSKEVANAMTEAFSAVPHVVDAVLTGEHHDGLASKIWRAVGAFSAAGGQVNGLFSGGCVVSFVEGVRSNAIVLSTGGSHSVITSDVDDHPSARLVENSSIQPVSGLEPVSTEVDLDRFLKASLALLPKQDCSSSTSEVTSWFCPLLALLQSRALQALQSMLAGANGVHFATALLRADAFARLLEASVLPLPLLQTSKMDLASVEQLALLCSATLFEAAHGSAEMRSIVSGSLAFVSEVQLALHLPSQLSRDEMLLLLRGLGVEERRCAAALDVCDGDYERALQLLATKEPSLPMKETAVPATSCAEQAVAELAMMGFSTALCRTALQRVGNDMQRAAEWLLEHSDAVSESGAGDAPAAAASSADATPAAAPAPVEDTRTQNLAESVDELLEVCDEYGQWHEAIVTQVHERASRVHFEGWRDEWDEWIERPSTRLRLRTGSAGRGPGTMKWASLGGSDKSRSQAASSAAAPADAASAPASPTPKPRGRSGWFKRGGASSKQAANEKSITRTCPSSDADFYPTDAGVARVIAPPEIEDDEQAEVLLGDALPGMRFRLRSANTAEDGAVGLVVGSGEAPAGNSSSSSSTEARLRLFDDGAPDGRLVSCSLSQLEPVTARLWQALPGLRGRPLAAVLRCHCLLHGSVAIMHARKAALFLLGELTWLGKAHADVDLRGVGPLPLIMQLVKLSSSVSLDSPGLDAFGNVWDALSGMLRDSSLWKPAPQLAKLPSILADEVVAFLAKSATSVLQVETSHPSSCVQFLQPLRCDGASMMQFNFDIRSNLSKGSRLALYLDAACTQQILCCEGDDLATCESLWIPTDCVWLHYQCEQNREHAWGFKLRASTVRWQARHERQMRQMPQGCGWELLQLMCEETPSEFVKPEELGNLLRYLQHGRAPYKERVCQVLLNLLPSLDLRAVEFDWRAFQTLERQVAWHEVLSQQQRVACALLPCSSQSMLDLLVELRESMQGCGLPVWESCLSCIDEVSELSCLSKWFLEPSEYRCPRVSLRHALRTMSIPHADSRWFEGWDLGMDTRLVEYVDRLVQGGGAPSLELRPSHLATTRDEHAAILGKVTAVDSKARCLRFALLQRFNQLVIKHLPLIHTAHTASSTKPAHTLGGRMCQLRGLIFFDAKLRFLQQSLASTATDAEAPSVLLNRLRAVAKQREDGISAHEHSVFAQLYEQLGRLRPQALCRMDKACRVNFVGEAADDHGGPYREAIAHICTELQSESLPLFIRCPNGVHGVGANRDAYLPNPSATSPQHIAWLCFIGQLLGLALRQKETQLSLSLPSGVWRQLVDEPLGEEDLLAFDESCWRSLQKLRRIDEEGITADDFSDVIFETFTTQLSDGAQAELWPNGAATAVTFDNRHEYCDLVVQARLHESQRQCDALLQGLSYVVPQRLLSLFTWKQLELLTCGTADVDVEQLRSHTKFGVGVSSSQRHIRYFWTALRRFTPEQRSAFLRFAWGRSRLPISAAEWGDTKFTLHTKQVSRPDSHYPVAHTCFFSLELPMYTSAAICQERLLYAITHCQAIDIDTTTGARENRELEWSDSDSD